MYENARETKLILKLFFLYMFFVPIRDTCSLGFSSTGSVGDTGIRSYIEQNCIRMMMSLSSPMRIL